MVKKASSSKRRAVLGADPFDTLVSPAASRPKAATSERSAKPARAQLNVLFDAWDWVDWLKAAAYIQRRLQRDVLTDALKGYEAGLSLAARREIRTQAEKYALER